MDVILVPGDCTSYIQASDVSWNKPSKQHCTECYDKWLSTVGITPENARENLKAHPRREVVQWILKILGQIKSRGHTKVFIISCTLTCARMEVKLTKSFPLKMAICVVKAVRC